ncbi:hypothetical protein B0H67DRAFT_575989 [Lasiosphaeris hirsuta]|uniref:Uncharacterized protein n=1 Tax=Lasiosphaeris hirsuta TaxID=260670 RepID=A0AA40AR18_9PEZI|nr:hypothetical protein B0H67DRAFT_575989 [Lasiosphaeris hirsuta]
MAPWHALVRTHHITSRKKVAHLRKAADKFSCYALLRIGGSPGIMYCRGSERGVREWVATVQGLRYKEFQLVSKPAMIEHEPAQPEGQPGLLEVESVKEFGDAMEKRGISGWWKRAMGFT